MENEKKGAIPSGNVENSDEFTHNPIHPAPAGANRAKSKKEIIKEMADDLRKSEVWDDLDGVLCRTKTASKLYKIGWRKQVQAEWVGIEYDGYADGVPVYEVWECSYCGNEWRGDEPPCYCPDCGAKMIGGL